MPRTDLTRLALAGSVVFAFAAPPASPAQAQTGLVKTIFEKYDLLGTLAWDCGKPVGRDNLYYVHRALDAGGVQRDQMSGPTTRDFVVVFERVAELRPNEIALGGTRNGEPLDVVYRVEQRRVRALEATVAGRIEVSGGRFVNGRETPWLHKCVPGGQAQPAPANPQPASVTALVVNGQARTFLLERPAGQGPRPTIIMLHEAGGSAAGIARESGLARLAPQQGFAAVFPQGLVANRWNPYPPGKETAGFIQMGRQVGGVPDDVAFLRLLVGELVRRGISDPKRIYLAGNSNGGFMTLRMVCVDVATFAAIALLSSGMPEPTGADCRPAKPIPVLMIKGSADQVVPTGGGLVANVLGVWPTQRLVGFFRELNGCAPGPPSRPSYPAEIPTRSRSSVGPDAPARPWNFIASSAAGTSCRPP